MKILIAVLLIVHGLIVAGQSSGSFNPVGGVKNPAWLSWWPANLGQSWLLIAIQRRANPCCQGRRYPLAGSRSSSGGCGAWRSRVHCPLHVVADSCPVWSSHFAHHAGHLPASLLRHWYRRQCSPSDSPRVGAMASAGAAWTYRRTAKSPKICHSA
jgi:hypothetical protein